MNSTSAALNVDGSLRGNAALPALSRRIIPALAQPVFEPGTNSQASSTR